MGNPAVAKRDGKQYSQPTKEGHTPARKAPFEEPGHKPSARGSLEMARSLLLS